MSSDAQALAAVHIGENSAPESSSWTVIEPSSGWASLKLGELWRYRELIYFLTWRDIKVRYKQTALGAAWAIIQPLVTMIVFTVIFGHIAHLPSDGVPYALFTLTALLPWTYFAYVLQQASTSLLTNANMISKVYFPRLVLPLSASFAGLLDFGIGFCVLVCMMVFYRVHPGMRIFTLPAFLLLAVVASLAVGLWLSALSVRYRDVKYVVPFLTQVWLYVSPVAYTPNLVKGKLAVVYALNPMVGVIEGFRWALLGTGSLQWAALVPSVTVTLLLLLGGLTYFRRMEQTFADVI